MWNIDLTLVDVVRISRDAYADAFRRVTGRPLVALPQLAGQSDSEIFFEALALNEGAAPVPQGGDGAADMEELLDRYTGQLAQAFAARRDQLPRRGRVLPGAVAAVAATTRLPGVVQSVLTGSIRPNAVLKLETFGLSRYLDTGIGGYGSEIYPKGAQLLRVRSRAAEKYGAGTGPAATVYIGDSSRDVEAARNGGACSIGVASGRCTPADLRDAGAGAVVADLSDTATVIATIDQMTGAAAAG
ncbi:MAG: HAD family hydrolase [Streptosporangiaceae bacterium]